MPSELTARIPIWILTDELPTMKHSVSTAINALYTFADFTTHTCYPSQRTLQTRAGLAPATLSKALQSLELRGLIRRSQWSRRRSTLYELAQTPDQAKQWATEFIPKTRPTKEHPNSPTLPFSQAQCAQKPHEISPSVSKTVTLSVSKSETLNYTHGNHAQLLLNFSPENWLPEELREKTRQALIRVGVRGTVPDSLLSAHPPEHILTVIRNAITRYASNKSRHNAHFKTTPFTFNLPGYVVAALNGARSDGKIPRKTKLCKRSLAEFDKKPSPVYTHTKAHWNAEKKRQTAAILAAEMQEVPPCQNH